MHQERPGHGNGSMGLGHLLHRATESVRAALDLRETLDRILLDVESTMPMDRTLIWLLDEDGRELGTLTGRSRGSRWNPGWTVPASWPPFRGALDRHEFDVQTDELLAHYQTDIDMPDLDPPEHLLVGPVRDAERTFGVFTIVRTDRDMPFSQTEITSFRTVAGLASIAISTSLAAEAERVQRQRVRSISEVTAALNSARSSGGVADALLGGVATLLGIDLASVALRSQDRPDHVEVYPSMPLRAAAPMSSQGMRRTHTSIEQRLMEENRSIPGPELRGLLLDEPFGDLDGVSALAAVPIRNGDALDGALYLWTPHSSDSTPITDIDPDDLASAESLCAQAAVALDRTRLQEQAQQNAQVQRSLASLASQLSSAITSEEMAATALVSVSAIVPMLYGRVTLSSGAHGDDEVLGELVNMPRADLRLATQLDTVEAKTRLSRTVSLGATTIDPVLARDVPLAWAASHAGCWPLTVGNSVIGTLTVVRDGPLGFVSHELELLSHASAQLALGLQRAEIHSEAVAARRLAERNAASMASLLEISIDMGRQHEVSGLLDVMDRKLGALVPHCGWCVYRADQERGELELIHRQGESGVGEERDTVPFGKDVAGRAASTRAIVRADTRAGEDGVSGRIAIGVPVQIENALFGVITLWRDPGTAFDDREASLLGLLSTHAASELRRIDLGRRARELYLGGIRALASTVDARDPYTRGHSGRVGQLARHIAEAMRLPREDVRRIEVAALLHDIGKVGIPDSILSKAAPLDQHELAMMMGHPELGASILREARSEPLDDVIPLVLHHHEWWDGRGYPRGLRKTEIPLGAQIISVADAFDSITHDRPYRSGASSEVAWEVIQDAAGFQFSPNVVAALGRVLEQGCPEEPLQDRDLEHRIPVTDRDETGILPEHPGDLRALGILVGLAQITSHITDLHDMLAQTLGMISRRLDMSVALVLRPDPARREELEAVCHTPEGFRVLDCPSPQCLDEVLAGPLPASLHAFDHVPGVRRMNGVFPTLHNVGVMPLLADEEPVGILMYSPNTGDRYWRADAELIEAIAPHVMAAINVARIHERAKEDARTDGLTGALNYRAFHDTLDALAGRSEPFVLLMFDVVGLKPVNDSAGHLAGDEVLRRTAAIIRRLLPLGSTVARIGGDEFGALVPGGTGDRDPGEIGAMIGDEMARESASEYGHPVTLRYGWAMFPDDGDTVEAVVHTADQAMYRHHARSGRHDRPVPRQ